MSKIILVFFVNLSDKRTFSETLKKNKKLFKSEEKLRSKFGSGKAEIQYEKILYNSNDCFIIFHANEMLLNSATEVLETLKPGDRKSVV